MYLPCISQVRCASIQNSSAAAAADPPKATASFGEGAGGTEAVSAEAAAAERARLKQVRSFLNAQARMIKGRQAQLHADQQSWKRHMRQLTASGSGGDEQERMHAIMRKLRHTIEQQVSS